MNIKIGDLIASQIEIKDLRQIDVASALDISYSTFNNYVCNTRLPDIETTIKICQYLEIDLIKVFDIHPSNDTTLNKNEAKLIRLFRSVDKNFQDKLLEVVQNLIQTLYKK